MGSFAERLNQLALQKEQRASHAICFSRTRERVWRAAHYKRLECSLGAYSGETDAKGRSLSVLCISNNGAPRIKMAESTTGCFCCESPFTSSCRFFRSLYQGGWVSFHLCVHLFSVFPKDSTERARTQEGAKKERAARQNPNIETRFLYYACLWGILIFIACYFYARVKRRGGKQLSWWEAEKVVRSLRTLCAGIIWFSFQCIKRGFAYPFKNHATARISISLIHTLRAQCYWFLPSATRILFCQGKSIYQIARRVN